jgi:hypothetical protein
MATVGNGPGRAHPPSGEVAGGTRPGPRRSPAVPRYEAGLVPVAEPEVLVAEATLGALTGLPARVDMNAAALAGRYTPELELDPGPA